MSTYSLINVTKEHPDGSVDGYWIQDYIGTLDGAAILALSTNRANSFKLHIAIVESIRSTNSILNYWINQKVIVNPKIFLNLKIRTNI